MADKDAREGAGCLRVVAVLENRAHEVGVAALDLGAPALFLSQSAETACFTNTLTLLQQHAPDVVITCSSAGTGSRLTQLLDKLFAGAARLVSLPRSSFDDTRGRSTVRLVATDKDALARAGKSLYLAFAAADACVRFCSEELQLLVRLLDGRRAPAPHSTPTALLC